MRKYLVLMESNFPEELQPTFTNLENASNAWGFPPEQRDAWCKNLEIKRMADHPETELLFYVGDAGSYDEKGKKVSRAMVQLLNQAEVDFAILGLEERSTGDEARRAGNEYLAQMMMTELAETLIGYAPKKIVTTCPHSYNILKNEYKQFGLETEVVHHTELLAEFIKQGKLKPHSLDSESITYHDSCYLGRWNDNYSAPREILNSIEGLNYRELSRANNTALCCGAGGARMFVEEDQNQRVNHKRCEEIIDTGVKTVAAACPYCATMLNDGMTDKKAEIEIKDIAIILAQATNGND